MAKIRPITKCTVCGKRWYHFPDGSTMQLSHTLSPEQPGDAKNTHVIVCGPCSKRDDYLSS